MSVGTVLLVILILILVGALPTWGYHSAGYWPSGSVGVAVVILIILLLLGIL